MVNIADRGGHQFHKSFQHQKADARICPGENGIYFNIILATEVPLN